MPKKLKKPYFFTWSSQQGNHYFETFGCDKFHLKTNFGDLLELSSLSYQSSFGLKNRKIEQAIIDQLSSFSMASTKSNFKLKEEVSNKLLDQLPDGRIFYTLSGAESVENALKIARFLKESPKVASLKNSYHGASLAALSVGGDWRTQAIKYTYKQGTLRLPPSQGKDCHKKLESFFNTIKSPISAVIIETVTGGNGCFEHDPKWLKMLSHFHKKLGFFLILDDVICAFGRLGTFLGHQSVSYLKPDMICFSKAITGGFIPFGALWVSETIAKEFDHRVLPCGLTNYAHPLGLAATKAVLSILEKPTFLNSLKEKIEISKDFAHSLEHFSQVKEVRQKGILIAIDLKEAIPITFFWENGVSLVLTQAGKRIILAPFLNIPNLLMKKGFRKISTIIESHK